MSDVTHGLHVSIWVIDEVLRNEEEPYIKLILHETSFWLSAFDQNAYILVSNMFYIQKNDDYEFNYRKCTGRYFFQIHKLKYKPI